MSPLVDQQGQHCLGPARRQGRRDEGAEEQAPQRRDAFHQAGPGPAAARPGRREKEWFRPGPKEARVDVKVGKRSSIGYIRG